MGKIAMSRRCAIKCAVQRVTTQALKPVLSKGVVAAALQAREAAGEA
jgi:hypothetical protein